MCPQRIHREVLKGVSADLEIVHHGDFSLLIAKSASTFLDLAEVLFQRSTEGFLVLVLEIFPYFSNFRFENGSVRGGLRGLGGRMLNFLRRRCTCKQQQARGGNGNHSHVFSWI